MNADLKGQKPRMNANLNAQDPLMNANKREKMDKKFISVHSRVLADQGKTANERE